MRLYRIAKTRYAHDLTGIGAQINGGRWNHAGIPCIYLSENRALSLLEYAAHTGINTLPPALSLTTLDVPEYSIRTLKGGELPVNWRKRSQRRENRDLGSSLLTESGCLLLKLPSPIISQEYSYVLNPRHPLIDKVKVTNVTSYKL